MTKIDIFSGFLGAGKTTLIKKLVKEAFQGEQIVIIENEFGEIGIDGGFLQDAGIQVTEMNSGCICCSLVGDFSIALSQVVDTYHPSRIIIEPSGVGKLSDVAAAVIRNHEHDFEISGLVAVVDANKCKVYAKNFGEFYINQIESASTIILSRTASISPEKLSACLSLIKEHNPEATLITTDWALLDGKQILQAIEHTDSLKETLKEMEAELHHHHDEECDDPECECHHHHHDAHDHHCCHDDDSEHHCHHHDGDENHEHHCCHHHEHEHDEHEHDEHECDDPSCECHHHHHDDHECSDPDCECHHHHDEKHHHHHADEVFTSWGIETAKIFNESMIKKILEELECEEKFGIVLRAKGIVAGENGWIHFDHVPGEQDIRIGSPAVTGRLCVIGSKLNEPAIAELFGA